MYRPKTFINTGNSKWSGIFSSTSGDFGRKNMSSKDCGLDGGEEPPAKGDMVWAIRNKTTTKWSLYWTEPGQKQAKHQYVRTIAGHCYFEDTDSSCGQYHSWWNQVLLP